MRSSSLLLLLLSISLSFSLISASATKPPPPPTATVGPTVTPTPTLIPTNYGGDSGPTTWDVIVGWEGVADEFFYADSAFAYQFFPSNLTIVEGDYVVFHFVTTETHTVSYSIYDNEFILVDGSIINNLTDSSQWFPTPESFGQPYTINSTTERFSSGTRAVRSPDLILEFDEAGDYVLFCIYHTLDMYINITVEAAGTYLEYDPSNVTADRDSAIADWEDQISQVEIPMPTDPEPNADGTYNYTVLVGYHDDITGAEFHRFFPTKSTIFEGDTIIFDASNSYAPHIVTFVGLAPSWNWTFPEFVTFDPATYEVVLFPPVSDPTDFYGMGYDGMGLASSGFLIASEYAADFNGAESYALTFNQAGLYKYVCSIHDDTQMVGFVEVLPSDNNGGGNNPPPGPGQDLPSNTVNVNFAGVFNGLLV